MSEPIEALAETLNGNPRARKFTIRSQIQAEAEVASLQEKIEELSAEKKHLFDDVQEKEHQLEHAQQTITAYAERVRRAEAYELAYRRQVDELRARAQLEQGAGQTA